MPGEMIDTGTQTRRAAHGDEAFVVVVGGGNATGDADRSPALGRSDGPRLLAAAHTAAAARRSRRLAELELAADEAERDAEVARRRVEDARSVADRRAGERQEADAAAARLDAERGEHEELLGRLRTHADALVAAVAGAERVLRQRLDAEQAIAELLERVSAGTEGLLDLQQRMQEAQDVLVRADAQRAGEMASALDALAECREALDASGDRRLSGAGRRPLGLAGLLRLECAVAAPDSGAAELSRLEADAAEAAGTARSAHDTLAAARDEMPAGVNAGEVLLAAVRAAASSPDPVIVEDLLADMDGETTETVLAGLVDAAGAAGLRYVTTDIRVLVWAMALDPQVGGVAGTTVTTTQR